jgi:hypothetical protein
VATSSEKIISIGARVRAGDVFGHPLRTLQPHDAQQHSMASSLTLLCQSSLRGGKSVFGEVVCWWPKHARTQTPLSSEPAAQIS